MHEHADTQPVSPYAIDPARLAPEVIVLTCHCHQIRPAVHIDEHLRPAGLPIERKGVGKKRFGIRGR